MDAQNTNHEEQLSLLDLTADIVAAYVGNNSITAGDLPGLIASVHDALAKAAGAGAEAPAEQERPTPPVSIKKSITPDAIISMEDGRPYKSMKRHLTSRGMTPDQYRQKWGLPHDYPMVAPSYAKARSELAKQMGLGRKASARPERASEGAKKGRSRKAA